MNDDQADRGRKMPDGCAVLRDLETGEWIAVPNFIGGAPPIGRFATRGEAVEALWEARSD